MKRRVPTPRSPTQRHGVSAGETAPAEPPAATAETPEGAEPAES